MKRTHILIFASLMLLTLGVVAKEHSKPKVQTYTATFNQSDEAVAWVVEKGSLITGEQGNRFYNLTTFLDEERNEVEITIFGSEVAPNPEPWGACSRTFWGGNHDHSALQAEAAAIKQAYISAGYTCVCMTEDIVPDNSDPSWPGTKYCMNVTASNQSDGCPCDL